MAGAKFHVAPSHIADQVDCVFYFFHHEGRWAVSDELSAGGFRAGLEKSGFQT